MPLPMDKSSDFLYGNEEKRNATYVRIAIKEAFITISTHCHQLHAQVIRK